MNHSACTRSSLRSIAFGLAAIVSAFTTSQAAAMTRGQTPQGWAFLQGGVGQTETDTMEAERGDYSLWVMTAARRSGASLSDVDVTILNDKGEPVFEQRIDGPWLLINLPLGRYEVRTRNGEERQSKITTIHPGDHHQAVFYFNVEAEVMPKP